MLSRRLRSSMVSPIVPTGVTGSSTSSTTLNFSAAVESGDVGIILSNRNPGGGNAPSGWTVIASKTFGTLYANTMSGGETSVTFASAPDQAVVAFFRNCIEPTTAESTYSTSGGDPNAPVSLVSAVPQDIVLVAICAGYASSSPTQVVPTGFSEVIALVGTFDSAVILSLIHI